MEAKGNKAGTFPETLMGPGVAPLCEIHVHSPASVLRLDELSAIYNQTGGRGLCACWVDNYSRSDFSYWMPSGKKIKGANIKG